MFSAEWQKWYSLPIGVVNELVAVRPAVVPGTDEVGIGFAAIGLQLTYEFANLVKALDLSDEGFPCVVREYIGIGNVAVVMEGFDVGSRRARYPEQGF